MLSMIAKDRQDKGNLSTENRNSIDDFVAHRMISTQWNKYKSQNIVIVTTGLSIGDKSLVKSIVKSLGMAKMELNVSRHTTHVVSTGVRTVNLLRGIIRGCWLITLEWVLKSLESNVWLNPEEFEMKHFSKAVMENREDRQLFGLSYIPELFTACGFIYVEHKTTMPCDTLKELIKTAGGHITENPKLARITVGANGLKETWVIDSITTGELQSTKLYQKK
ncbi:Microcephalin [Harpegnathos saltator]|uniref:Microcephalin n=2 Tax=Harpegnathos saltator TaxID=610380 RepID=E2BFM0_HARSA|nr:Microcephalin [Harpegnathos saltator]